MKLTRKSNIYLSLFNRKLISCLLMLICLTVFASAASAKESSLLESSIFVDNQPIQTQYVMKDGQMMVPALFFKYTGSRVNWNQTYDSIVFELGSVKFSNPTGSNYVDYQDETTNQWKRDQWPVASIHVDNQTFVPLVDVAKKLGLKIHYDDQSKTTSIQNPVQRTAKRIGSGPTSGKQIALTFDDGPDATYTTQILDILEEKGVPGTFFVVGQQVDKFPKLVRRIVRDGHGLANHSFTHPNFTKIQSSDVQNEILNTQRSIANVVRRQPDLFRPPYGLMTRADEDFLEKRGFRVILWSVDTLDWTGLSGDEIYSRVIQDISPGGIILQHNIDVNPGMLDGTVEALPRIIDQLKAEGYTFVTVQTLLD
ncbi:polysaccharide deacetylase [Salipaludibacillus keqinensis]|uniref:Polysaccharide deacetylase n=1 Tax=Salipaludibacillus keqinensis TaxID=2045207 RepID=A0A323TET2_9BACI|nr:polysaccharide deacetylase family protein [Salipaludibacillus keqinensis]PYZ93439.1 polysaccharide deacetylase [Salipaludibacillus keqinensis]